LGRVADGEPAITWRHATPRRSAANQSDEPEELHRLRRENQTLRMERELLKKVAAFS
jgi:transposase-like protein